MLYEHLPKDTLACRLEQPTFQLVDDLPNLLSYSQPSNWVGKNDPGHYAADAGASTPANGKATVGSVIES